MPSRMPYAFNLQNIRCVLTLSHPHERVINKLQIWIIDWNLATKLAPRKQAHRVLYTMCKVRGRIWTNICTQKHEGHEHRTKKRCKTYDTYSFKCMHTYFHNSKTNAFSKNITIQCVIQTCGQTPCLNINSANIMCSPKHRCILSTYSLATCLNQTRSQLLIT